MDIQLEILLLFYMPNHFKRPPSNMSYNSCYTRVRAKPDEEIAGERTFEAGRRFSRVVNNRKLYKAKHTTKYKVN